MDDLIGEEEWQALKDAYWDNPVSGVLESYFPSQADIHVREPAESALPHLWLMVQNDGRSKVTLGSREFELAPGDMALSMLDGARQPVPRSWRQSHFLFPLEEAKAPRRPERLPAVLPGSCPATALLIQFAQCLSGSAANLPPRLRIQFQERLLDMLDDALAAREEAGQVSEDPARVHVHRIKAYLCLHLREPDLSVKKVAKALGLSLSHMHRVFAGEGQTMADWLWSRRLEGSATELAHPDTAHLPVSDIALSWGFNDLSHFSHAFKRRFGVSPKDWRKQVNKNGPLPGTNSRA